MALKDWKTWLGSEFSINKCTFVALMPCPFAVVVYMGCDMPLYAFSLFLPSIINQVKFIYSGIDLYAKSIRISLVWARTIQPKACVNGYARCLGFTATPANLLTVPVYVFACIITCGVGFLADRWGRRGYFNM